MKRFNRSIVYIFATFTACVLCDMAVARTLVVDNGSANAADSNAGTATAPLKSISEAARLAEPGDTVLVKAGVYRERVAPERGGTKEQPIRYVAESGQGVFVKGSEVLDGGWHVSKDTSDVWAVELKSSLFGDYTPFEIPRAAKFPDFVEWSEQHSLGQVFVDGMLLVQVLDVAQLNTTPGTWFKGKEGATLQVHFSAGSSPETSLVEVSVRERIFAPRKRGLGYITVEGFVFEHCANQYPKNFWMAVESAQAGAVGCGSGHHWVIQNNVIRYANTVGLDCGSETGKKLHGEPIPTVNAVGYHVIRNNVIEDNGCTGITGWMHRGTQITGNVIQRNNRLGIMSWETAGIKLHGFYDGVIKDNLIRDNDAWGIWLDNVYKGSRIEGNVIISNLWGGVFLEMGNGPLVIANNVIAYSVSGNETHHRGGHGIYGHDASGVTVAHNLLYANAGMGVTARIVADRTVAGKPAEASRWVVRNNLILGNKSGDVAFTVPFDRATDNVSNHNVFMVSGLGKEAGRFALNTVTTSTAKQPVEKVVAYLQETMVEKNVPQASFPALATWARVPWMALPEWQQVLGQDRDSTLLNPNSSMTLRRGTLQFHTAPEAGVYKKRFPKFDAVDQDYFGNPLEGEQVFAGPFQNAKGATESLVLWPKD